MLNLQVFLWMDYFASLRRTYERPEPRLQAYSSVEVTIDGVAFNPVERLKWLDRYRR